MSVICPFCNKETTIITSSSSCNTGYTSCYAFAKCFCCNQGVVTESSNEKHAEELFYELIEKLKLKSLCDVCANKQGDTYPPECHTEHDCLPVLSCQLFREKSRD